MGRLIYDDTADYIDVDDVVLAHLKVVIATKLRRQESFTLSWRHPDQHPDGRSTIWLHPAIPLHFIFDDPEPPQLDGAIIEEMMREANSTGGLTITVSSWPVDEAGLPPAV